MVLQTCKCSDSFMFLLQAQDPDPSVSSPSPNPVPRTDTAVQVFWTVPTKSKQQAIQKTPRFPRVLLWTTSSSPATKLERIELSRAGSAVLPPSVRSSLTGSLFSKPSGCVCSSWISQVVFSVHPHWESFPVPQRNRTKKGTAVARSLLQN